MTRIPGAAGLTVEQKRELAARLLREKAAARPAAPPLLPALFEERAAASPQAVAVSDGAESLTYRELDRRANRLARRLRGMGARPETLVGVYLGRSCSTLAALLAVHRAGAAYVPLDPAFPAGRLRHMVEDSGLRVLITEEATRSGIPGLGLEQLRLDDDDSSEGDDDRPVRTAIDARNLAYVLYTSGSTGKPKGVQVTHGALANFLLSMRSIVGMKARDAILAVTTLSFDIAALELFLPLICGARVEIADRETAADGWRLAKRLDDPALTFLQATPATWRSLLEAGWRGKRGLTMLCGGEALPRSLADRLLDRGEALWNVYGPTETTIWSSAWRVEPGDAPIVIGHPLAKTQLLVLDHRLRPAPVGVTGELYIGGEGLARGYLNRRGLTAERFLPDPTGSSAGARIYRTGDLARRRADTTIECLGRVDHQVKIRGYRIELGEIEAALSKHEALREAAVIARPDASGESSLAAFLVPRTGGEVPSPQALRARLLEQLPDYMVPSTFTTLTALPLTPNGKVDRRALAEAEAAPAPAAAAHQPPRGAMEESIAGLWADLLGVPRLGVLDNFFERGGHSLLVIQMLARLRQTFSVDVPLREFTDQPTVAGLSRLVEASLAGRGVAAMAPIERLPRDGSAPAASFAQQRLWYLDQLEPGDVAYNIPMAVRLEGSLDTAALSKALTEIVRRHETLRTTFEARDGVPLQRIAAAADLPIEVEPLDGADEQRLRERLRELGSRPFDLARGPLLRATLLRLAPEDHVLSLVVHHVAADGWSMGILVREATALYDAFRRGEPSPLPEPAVQYADFAAWQRRDLSGDRLDAQLSFWRDRLTDFVPVEIPADRPAPARPTNRAGEIRGQLDGDTLNALKRLGRDSGATLFMTLLAAFDVLLSRHSGREDVAIGTPVAGRSRPEVEGLIGFFVNTLVIRSDLSGSPTFRELLTRVRGDALDAYAHQDLPFERLVGELRESPFRAMLVLQNAPLPPLETEGLRLSAIDPPATVAKFDATLFAMEQDGGLDLILEYRAERFEAATMDRLLAGYLRLLAEVIADADRPIGEIPMISPGERARMLNDWNQPASDDLGIDA